MLRVHIVYRSTLSDRLITHSYLISNNERETMISVLEQAGIAHLPTANLISFTINKED